MSKRESKLMYSDQRCHAYSYIRDLAKSEIGDRSAYMFEDKSVYLPYRRKSYIYGEYVHYCTHYKIPVCASLSTFIRAYADVVKDLKKKDDINLKLSGGKCMSIIFYLLQGQCMWFNVTSCLCC